MKQKIHPNSLANLTRDGRPQNYEEPKKIRSVSVTTTGWDGLKAIAQTMGISTSELLEKLGRGELTIASVVVCMEAGEDGSVA